MSRAPQCLKCKFADWEKTAAGRLHPSGDGRCRWTFPPEVPLPVSMYFVGGPMRPSGGHINRRDEWRQCSQFEPAEDVLP